MAEREIFPATSDEDFVLALTYDAPVVQIQKMATLPGQKNGVMADGASFVGELRAPILVGSSVDVANQFCISAVSKVLISSDVSDIRFVTASSVYRLLSLPKKPGRLPSLQYFRRGYLRPDETMGRGFFDGGAEALFYADPDKKTLRIPYAPGGREIIFFDEKLDANLCDYVKQARALLSITSDLRIKTTLLALFVSDVLGGRGTQTFVQEMENEIQHLTRKTDGWLAIGNLTKGACRHRALLFQYLANRCALPVRLVRGLYKSGKHQWNVAELGSDFYIVDVMNHPSELYPENSPRAKRYMRYGGDGQRGHIGGRSVPLPVTPVVAGRRGV